MKNRVRLGTIVLAALLCLVLPPGAAARASLQGSSVSPTTASPCGSTATPGTYKHVIVIFMENYSYSAIFGNTANAPYINSLASECGYASNYHNITHPSLPNYIAATNGADLARLTPYLSDCTPSSTCDATTGSVFGQTMATAKLGWKAFAESMPSACYASNSGYYAPRHNPAVYYSKLATSCPKRDLVLGTTTSTPLTTALSNDSTAPGFIWITPNLCDDMHKTTGCPSNYILTGDTWLSQWVPIITSSPAYQAGDTALFITWDEGEGGSYARGENCATNTTDPSCHVLLIAVAPSVVPGTVDSSVANHYSLLKTTEQLLGLTQLGEAAGANSMETAFNL